MVTTYFMEQTSTIHSVDTGFVFEPEVFRKQMYGIEEITRDIVGTFGAPRSDSAPP